ncbi:hypothetical protein COO91_11015 (plasmid) [Nostoc flagelliforme CCNUN1]|uniref:Uncharacterized protein n=1 Tax=Nostoc flagelliforme CCNUN1 TaxID=2038116 RepID=A0A2K8TAS7_9NOSO|nr:hypothetical protein [Nostoc flagelliforme]AUB44770.1 hypothetical protein COO91_11015 [Nostoc flagelliforme CCNUN1]
MATIKISELQPKNQFEKVSDADLQAVNGGQAFQLVLGSTSATTGAAVGGGSVANSTNSFFNVNGGVGSPFFSASATSNALSSSSPF